MKLLMALVAMAIAAHPTVASSQTVAVELTQTVGASTESVAAAATQIRAFGEVAGGVRFMGEGAWAARSSSGTDAFGAAYPYANRAQVIEAYGERTFQPGPFLVGIRGGRYRTPFGISSASDHAYDGFFRAPLIRYDNYYALSNNFLEHGADVIVGVPRLTLEVSAGTPSDVGAASRRSGLDTVVRGQGVIGALIVGMSYIRTTPYEDEYYAKGRAVFTGVDLRFMRGGVQVRGEWISGRPFDGTTTTGGYADLIVHRPSMGPITAVMRAEHLAYEVGSPYQLYGTRYTGGARIRVLGRLTAAVDVIHQSGALPQRHSTTVDVGVTYSVRSH
ncbi:MAG: hypothetical protein ABJA98_02180 [Acidobacteriota bacterium]